MKKNSTRFLLVALVVVVAMVMTAMGVSAAPADASAANKNYNAETLVYSGGDAVEFLTDALDAAENGDVVVDLQADMTFDAEANYALTEIKATSGEIPENTITVTSTTGNGIVMGAYFPSVALYGNFQFSDITYGAVEEKVNGNGLIFPDGCSGTFGYVDGESWGGITAGAKKANVAGNVTVYSGNYLVIAGNLYNSKLTIDAPTVIARGNTRATQGIYGGCYNGGSGKVIGTSTLEVLDQAWGATLGCSGYYGDTDATRGGTMLVNTSSTEVIDVLVAGNTGSYGGAATFTTTIKNGKFNIVCGTRSTSGDYDSHDGIVVNLTIEGGSFAGNLYCGLHTRNEGFDKDIKGTYTTTIKGGEFTSAIYNGSYVNAAKKKAITISSTNTLTIEGGKFNASVYGSDGVVSSEVLDGETGSAVMHNTGVYSLIIKDGSFSGVYGGSYMTRTANYENTLNLTIEGGEVTGSVYGGSNLNSGAEGALTYGTTLNATITGGVFKSQVYLGSYMNHAGSKTVHDIHSGDTTAVIKGGQFQKGVYGGSATSANKDAEHSGDTVLTLQGTAGKTIEIGSYLSAGSNASYNSIHSGKTTLNIADIIMATTISGKTVNFARYGTSSLYFVGGALLNAGSADAGYCYQTADSEVVIKRSVLTTVCAGIYAGARIDGVKNAQMTGKSTLTVDANTGLVYNEGTEAYEEKTGENGFAYIGTEIFGGTYLNGYNTHASLAKYSQAINLGKSVVILNAPADREADNLAKQLTLAKDVYGCSSHSGNIRHWQVADSSVYINGYVDKTGTVRVFGGSKLGNKAYAAPSASYYGGLTAGHSNVVIDGTFEGDVYGGCSNARSAAVTYTLNSGIVLKSGDVVGKMCLGSLNTTSTEAAIHTHKGLVFFELWDASTNSDGMKIIFDDDFTRSPLDSTTKKGFKVIGNFTDYEKGDGANNAYDIFTNVSFDTLDYIQEAGGLSFGLCQDDGTIIYRDDNPSKVKSAYSTGIERIDYRKLIKICTSASTTTNPVQIPFVAGMTFEDFLNQSGVKIHNSYDPTKTQTVSNNIVSYADIARYNALSESPNVYRFFMVNADGKKGEEITTIGSATDKYYVQVGNYTSSATSVENTTLGETVGTIQNAENYLGTGFSIRVGSNLGFRYRAKINKTFLETYIAELEDGSNGFMIKELGIKVSAENINGNPWSTKAVAWTNGAIVAGVQQGWLEDETDPNFYYFAAVLTGFENMADRIDTDFTFEVYATYEDANGEVHEVAVGAAQTSSLYDTAVKLSTEAEYAEWYNEYKEEVDAILAIVENAKA